jgi:hypothetical protein
MSRDCTNRKVDKHFMEQGLPNSNVSSVFISSIPFIMGRCLPCCSFIMGTCFFAYRDSSAPPRHGGAPRRRGTTGSPTPALADVAAISHVLCLSLSLSFAAATTTAGATGGRRRNEGGWGWREAAWTPHVAFILDDAGCGVRPEERNGCVAFTVPAAGE